MVDAVIQEGDTENPWWTRQGMYLLGDMFTRRLSADDDHKTSISTACMHSSVGVQCLDQVGRCQPFPCSFGRLAQFSPSTRVSTRSNVEWTSGLHHSQLGQRGGNVIIGFILLITSPLGAHLIHLLFGLALVRKT